MDWKEQIMQQDLEQTGFFRELENISYPQCRKTIKKQSMKSESKHTKQLKEEYPTIYEGYEQIMKEQFELFAKKHIDYGMSNISAGTQLQNDEEKEFALTGLWYRINDKVNRWKNLLINKVAANNEPLTDTYQDLTNYGIIAQLVERGMWKK
jgi:hypothetical protein|tara:strand:+ start:22753 stop:23208 length:456 start_codon:yes stop_codon:yes gene_type:complete